MQPIRDMIRENKHHKLDDPSGARPPIPGRARAAYLPAESELNVMSVYRKLLLPHLSDAQEPRNRVTRPHYLGTL
jgi:hypothetical protein